MTEIFYKTSIKTSVFVFSLWALVGFILGFFNGVEFLMGWFLSGFLITLGFEKIESKKEED